MVATSCRARYGWRLRSVIGAAPCKNSFEGFKGVRLSGRFPVPKGGAMSRKKAKMLFWAALVVLAYIPYLMQSAGHAIM